MNKISTLSALSSTINNIKKMMRPSSIRKKLFKRNTHSGTERPVQNLTVSVTTLYLCIIYKGTFPKPNYVYLEILNRTLYSSQILFKILIIKFT
jgi:hypothetical protein